MEKSSNICRFSLYILKKTKQFSLMMLLMIMMMTLPDDGLVWRQTDNPATVTVTVTVNTSEIISSTFRVFPSTVMMNTRRRLIG